MNCESVVKSLEVFSKAPPGANIVPAEALLTKFVGEASNRPATCAMLEQELTRASAKDATGFLLAMRDFVQLRLH